MTAAVDKAVAAIRAGKRSSVYLLHGDEYLAREGAKALVAALVPAERHAFSVEVVGEEQELASIPGRLRTGSLFGGLKVVVVHDSKLFVTKQSTGKFFEKSRDAWRDGESDRAVKTFLQGLAAAGDGEELLAKILHGTLAAEEAARRLGTELDDETASWVREMGERILRDDLSIPAGPGVNPGRVYEELLTRGLPAESVLILTAEVVDERRSLFKALAGQGAVIDVSLRSRKGYDTQMSLDAARARIRGAASEAGKTVDRESVEYILERTGLSMRALAAELEKLILYVGPRPTIALADVRQVLSVSREAGMFDLTNAVAARDAARALTALRNLLVQREPAIKLLGALAHEVRNLLLARCLIDAKLQGRFDAGMPFAAFQARILPAVAAEVGERMHPFRLYNMLRGAAAFSQDELLRALLDIADTDVSLKTSGQPESLLLETLLLRICAAPHAAAAGRNAGRASS